MENHLRILAQLCLICGRRLQTAQQIKAGKGDFVKEIYAAFNISIWGDESEVHPTHVCYKCSRALQYSGERDRNVESSQESAINVRKIEWQKHPRTGPCKVCDAYRNQSKGGHPPHRKRPGRVASHHLMRMHEYAAYSVRCCYWASFGQTFTIQLFTKEQQCVIVKVLTQVFNQKNLKSFDEVVLVGSLDRSAPRDAIVCVQM